MVDTLGVLVQAYEDIHEAEAMVPNQALLQFLMDEHNLTPADVSEIGDAATVQAVLSGQRGLSHAQIAALARRFGVSADTFIEQ